MTTLISLHGFDSCADRAPEEYRGGLLCRLADNVISFNAPHAGSVPGRYQWFLNPVDENKNHNIMPELKQSAEYIVEKIRAANIDDRDLILFGNSQGGFVAMYLTLAGIIVPKKTIAVVPFYIRELIPEKINQATPVLWLAAGKDNWMPPVVTETWADLKAAGANLDYHVDSHSGHKDWSPEFEQHMIDWNKNN